jgi:hypothetical protein
MKDDLVTGPAAGLLLQALNDMAALGLSHRELGQVLVGAGMTLLAMGSDGGPPDRKAIEALVRSLAADDASSRH